MRNQTPLVPGRPAFDVTVYIVLNDFGPLGHACCETDETDADEEADCRKHFEWAVFTSAWGGRVQRGRRLGPRCD